MQATVAVAHGTVRALNGRDGICPLGICRQPPPQQQQQQQPRSNCRVDRVVTRTTTAVYGRRTELKQNLEIGNAKLFVSLKVTKMEQEGISIVHCVGARYRYIHMLACLNGETDRYSSTIICFYCCVFFHPVSLFHSPFNSYHSHSCFVFGHIFSVLEQDIMIFMFIF
jgi:hypothetical protein